METKRSKAAGKWRKREKSRRGSAHERSGRPRSFPLSLSLFLQFIFSGLLARIRNGWRYSTQENVDKPGFPVLPNYILFDMRDFDEVLFYDKYSSYEFKIISFLLILRWLLSLL